MVKQYLDDTDILIYGDLYCGSHTDLNWQRIPDVWVGRPLRKYRDHIYTQYAITAGLPTRLIDKLLAGGITDIGIAKRYVPTWWDVLKRTIGF